MKVVISSLRQLRVISVGKVMFTGKSQRSGSINGVNGQVNQLPGRNSKTGSVVLSAAVLVAFNSLRRGKE